MSPITGIVIGYLALFAFCAITRLTIFLRGRSAPWIYPMWRPSPQFASPRLNRSVDVSTKIAVPAGVLLFLASCFALIAEPDSSTAAFLALTAVLVMFSRTVLIEYGFAFGEQASTSADDSATASTA